MRTRLDLDKILRGIEGVKKVYYQAPDKTLMEYPCILYSPARPSVRHANNNKYINHRHFEITLIDKNPDSEIADRIENLQYCSRENFFVSDGLNHFVYEIYI